MIAKLFFRNIVGKNLVGESNLSKGFFFSTIQTNQPNRNEKSGEQNPRGRNDFQRGPRRTYDKTENRGNQLENQEREDKPRQKTIQTLEEYINQHASAKIHSLKEVQFPFNFKGMPDFAPVKKEFDDMIFPKGEEYAEAIKTFDNKMVQFLKALAENKDDELPFSEINFLLKAKKGAELLRRNGYKLKLVEDLEGFEKSKLEKGGKPFEISHIMGLSSDRTKNAGTASYMIYRKLEEKGLLMFVGNQLKIDQEGSYDFLQTRDDDKQMILRVHYKYASPYVLVVTDNQGKVVSPQPESYIHTAVFENQLRLPPKFSRLDLHFNEWIKLYRIQKDWQLVDYDRFVQGNRLIYSEQEYSQLVYVQN